MLFDVTHVKCCTVILWLQGAGYSKRGNNYLGTRFSSRFHCSKENTSLRAFTNTGFLRVLLQIRDHRFDHFFFKRWKTAPTQPGHTSKRFCQFSCFIFFWRRSSCYYCRASEFKWVKRNIQNLLIYLGRSVVTIKRFKAVEPRAYLKSKCCGNTADTLHKFIRFADITWRSGWGYCTGLHGS